MSESILYPPGTRKPTTYYEVWRWVPERQWLLIFDENSDSIFPTIEEAAQTRDGHIERLNGDPEEYCILEVTQTKTVVDDGAVGWKGTKEQ